MLMKNIWRLAMSAIAFVALPLVAIGRESSAPDTGGEEDAPVFQRSFLEKGNFIDTLLASRARFQAGTKIYASTPWHVSGWEGESLDTPLPPDRGPIDLSRKGPFRKTRKSEFHEPGKRVLFGGKITYLYREFTCTEACTVQGLLSIERGQVRVVLNGRSLAQTGEETARHPTRLPLTMPFNPGKNTLLIKLAKFGRNTFRLQMDAEPLDLAMGDLKTAYPAQMGLLNAYLRDMDMWFATPGSDDMLKSTAAGLMRKLHRFDDLQALYEKVVVRDPAKAPAADLRVLMEIAGMVDQFADLRSNWSYRINPEALRRAIADLQSTHADYPGEAFLKRLDGFGDLAALQKDVSRGRKDALDRCREYLQLKREALMANPLLDFEQVVLVKREQKGASGFPHNYEGNSSVDWHLDDSIVTLRIREENPDLHVIYKPKKHVYCGEIDLDYDAGKLLFSSIGESGNWHVFEIGMDGRGLRQVSQSAPDLDNYDAVYLPDGNIIYNCTSGYNGVPCVGGGAYVANLHKMNRDGGEVRRLTFEQDNDWNPVVLPNGQVMFLRWEYTDSAHYFSRVLMHMNPDGTNQVAAYGSNSYWPNAIFFARPVPGSNSKFVGVVSGHHGTARYGQCVLFDSARGRHETEGVVQAIPGFGKTVEPVVRDGLVAGYRPLSLTPYPLSDKYFLMSLRDRRNNTGLYLVDVFDNMLLVKNLPGFILYDAIPVRKTPRPPVIPDRIDLKSRESTVFLQDIYAGDGLRGVPPGTVKNLRIFQYVYSYRNTGGHTVIGNEGPWDVRRVIGTVPVFPDGSAIFKVPANTPVAVQPLDKDGKALAIMRSWFSAMPGETVSCVGCHEKQNSAPFTRPSLASGKEPSTPKPFHGPKRGFSFVAEIQPVLDRYCVGCHSGEEAIAAKIPDFSYSKNYPRTRGVGRFSASYHALQRYVRRNGPEGDYHMLTPLEFHAGTSELIEILEKGHHGVKLDREAMDKLIAWIDLNVPFHGSWNEATGLENSKRHTTADNVSFVARRRELMKLYALVDENIETEPGEYTPRDFVKPAEVRRPKGPDSLPGWPFPASRAAEMQGPDARMAVDMGGGESITFVRIPAGRFLMGSATGEMDEAPRCVVAIEKPFWMSEKEITNKQYQIFDPQHDSGVLDRWGKDQTNRGFFVNQPELPVIRVPWTRARAFCDWLARKSGRKVALPTEAQWEWACRAGTDTPMHYGATAAVFSKFENLADVTTKQLPRAGMRCTPVPDPDPLRAFLPADYRSDDGALLQVAPGGYKPNRWGLFDMHGNVMEWTRSLYKPYPYRENDGRNKLQSPGRRVARGGNWRARPKRATSSYRRAYAPWQEVYSVGIRLVIEE